MHVEQFVMAYGVEQDRLRAILPEGFSSLRWSSLLPCRRAIFAAG